MSRTIPPAPAWRLFPGRSPIDVQLCAYLACMTAFTVVLFIGGAYIFPEPNSRRGIVEMAWGAAFWSYLPFCLHMGDIAVDRQARYQRILQEQTVENHGHHHERNIAAGRIDSKELNSDSKTFLTAPHPRSNNIHASEAQVQPRKGWFARFDDGILAGINPRGYSSQQLTRRFTISCILMIEGLVLLPAIIYLAQKLFLPEDDVEYMVINVPSWSLLLSSFSSIGLSKYSSILQKRKERDEKMAREMGKQDPPEPSGAQRDEEAGQCDSL